MSNKYSEGYPNARYYGGNEFIDQAELLCQKRALDLFDLDPELWGVNVQPLSGSPANFHVYTALLKPHARILGLDLPHGGHLSHGYQTPAKKISAVSTYFETFGYQCNLETGRIDYDALDVLANRVRPDLIVAGASAYSRHYDYARMRDIADANGSYLLSDMAHISGLVAAGIGPSPFEFSDVVTTTTHKTLRGPRGAMIFYRKGLRKKGKGKKKDVMYDLQDKIDFAVFPGCQGGPHNHTITALATALKQANQPAFKEYQNQVVSNASAMANALSEKGYTLVSGGTDNHLVLIDVKQSMGIDGARAEAVLERAGISLNKNTVPTDTSALVPSGLRVGAPSLTSRGFVESDFEQVAEFLHRGVKLTCKIREDMGDKGKKMASFKQNLGDYSNEINELKRDVASFCETFPVVGFVEDDMVYKDGIAADA
jgi:glycine hydroxymethyltransferase